MANLKNSSLNITVGLGTSTYTATSDGIVTISAVSSVTSGGAAGTSGYAGGLGAAGYIEVTEMYS